LILVPEWIFQSGVGGSEPLLAGLLLAAVDRHADKADGQGFLLVLLASLLRPESWPPLLVSAAVTWIRRPRLPPFVVAGVMAVPVRWCGGEYVAAGDPFGGGYLARMSLEARLLRHGATPPFWAVLGKASSALPVAVLASAPIAVWRGLARRDPIVL